MKWSETKAAAAWNVPDSRRGVFRSCRQERDELEKPDRSHSAADGPAVRQPFSRGYRSASVPGSSESARTQTSSACTTRIIRGRGLDGAAN
jgi:hypothetical protein